MQIEKDQQFCRKWWRDLTKHFREREIPKIDEYIKDVQSHYCSGEVHSGISFYVCMIRNFQDWEYQVLSRTWDTKTLINCRGGGVKLCCHSGNSWALPRVEDVSVLPTAKQVHSYIYTLEKLFHLWTKKHVPKYSQQLCHTKKWKKRVKEKNKTRNNLNI